MKKPNILYLHSHDTGRTIQPYGHAVATPNFQKLAGEGVLFRQAFTAGPTCSPSRACLLTGQYAHSNGMLGLAHRGFSLNDYSRHILHTLRKEGYTSALAGVQHIADHRQGTPPWKTIGYDVFLGETDEAHTKAVEFLSQRSDKPFFLSVGFVETHRDFPAEHPQDDARYCLPPAPLPDTPEIREDMAQFKQSARILDDKMGAVLDALDRSGLADNTLVICTTDHGIAFPRMKCNLEDSGIGVMLIMRGPGGFRGGKVIDGLVSQVDLFPTICELLGIEPPDWLEGQSFLPLVTGEKNEIHDAIFAEINYHAAYEPMRCARTRRWKYIRRYDPRTRPVLPNTDAGLSKSVWLDCGWTDVLPVEEALYDLVFDPNEKKNLATDEKYGVVLEKMKQKLADWMLRTKDPLLQGEIPLPNTAHLNSRDQIHPGDEKLPLGVR